MPLLSDGHECLLHGQRHAHRLHCRLFDRHRIVEKHHHRVAGETLQRAFVCHHQLTHGSMKTVQHFHHLFGFGLVGEGGEAAQVEEHHADLAPVRLEHVRATRNDGLTQLRREEAFQTAQRFDLPDLLPYPLLQRLVPLRDLGRLRLDFVLQRLDAQQRLDACEQFGAVDRLGQEIIGTGFDAVDALLRRIERSA